MFQNRGSQAFLATDSGMLTSERQPLHIHNLDGPQTLVTCLHVAEFKGSGKDGGQKEIVLICTECGKIWIAEIILNDASYEFKLHGSAESPIVANNIVRILEHGGNRRFLINGDNGDSAVVLIALKASEIEIEIVQRLTMLGLTPDFAVLSDREVNEGEDFDLLLCSGTGKHASIRRLRYGLPMETHVWSEKGLCEGIIGLYTIIFEQQHDQSLLLMAFTTGCRVLTIGSDLRDVTDDLGLNSNALTLYAAANADGCLIQVSEQEVVVVQQPVLDSMDLDVIPCSQPERAVWRPGDSSKISVCTSLGNILMCSTCGGSSIHVLDTTRDPDKFGEFEMIGEVANFSSSEEVSCMAMTRLAAGTDSERTIAMLGTYADTLQASAGKLKIYLLKSKEVELAQTIDLGVYSRSDLSGSVPQSLAILPGPAEGVFLVVGLRNGKVIIFTLDDHSLAIVGSGTTRRLAESPITFVRISSYAGPSLIALVQDVTFLVTPSRASLQFQRISLHPGGISHVAPFICEASPLGMAIVVDSQLRVVSIDRCEKLDVRTIPLVEDTSLPGAAQDRGDGFVPARVLWHPDAKFAVVGCNFSREVRDQVSGREEERVQEVMCCELRLIDHSSWSTVHIQHIGENERIHSLALYRTPDDEALVCVGTGPELTGPYKSDHSAFQFQRGAGNSGDPDVERSSDSESDDERFDDDNMSGSEMIFKRRRREEKRTARLLIWRIVQKQEGGPELVMVASISMRNACRAICQYQVKHVDRRLQPDCMWQGSLAVASGETWTLYEFSKVRWTKERNSKKIRFRKFLSKSARFAITSLTSNGIYLAVGDCVDSFSVWRVAFPAFSGQVISGITEMKTAPGSSHLFMMPNVSRNLFRLLLTKSVSARENSKVPSGHGRPSSLRYEL
eukprot:768104-Hanusia_phi.AAC.14